MEDEYEKYIHEAMAGTVKTADPKICTECKIQFQAEACPQCGKKIEDPDEAKEYDRRERR